MFTVHPKVQGYRGPDAKLGAHVTDGSMGRVHKDDLEVLVGGVLQMLFEVTDRKIAFER